LAHQHHIKALHGPLALSLPRIQRSFNPLLRKLASSLNTTSLHPRTVKYPHFTFLLHYGSPTFKSHAHYMTPLPALSSTPQPHLPSSKQTTKQTKRQPRSNNHVRQQISLPHRSTKPPSSLHVQQPQKKSILLHTRSTASAITLPEPRCIEQQHTTGVSASKSANERRRRRRRHRLGQRTQRPRRSWS
jgi:hypothetical protein